MLNRLTLCQLRLDVVLLEPWNSTLRKIQAYRTIQLHNGIENALRIEGLRVAHFNFVFQSLYEADVEYSIDQTTW